MNHNISILRGVVILLVLIDHYICAFISVHHGVCANGYVGMFFIASGFVTKQSFNRTTSVNTAKFCFSFFAKKVMRIYPLLWIYLAIYSIKEPYSFFAWVGLDLIGLPWFASAIIQCYLCAYLFYNVTKINHNALRYSLFLSICVVFIIVYHLTLPHRLPFTYQGLPAGHIILFGLGMFVPTLAIRSSREDYFAAILFLSFYICVTYINGSKFDFTELIRTAFSIIFIVCTYFVFVGFIAIKITSRGTRWLASMGNNSYGIYLFHMLFYASLHRLNIIDYHSIGSIFVTSGLFPLFFYCVSRFEQQANVFTTNILFLVLNKLNLASTQR